MAYISRWWHVQVSIHLLFKVFAEYTQISSTITYQKSIPSHAPATPLKDPRTRVKSTVVSPFPSLLFLEQKNIWIDASVCYTWTLIKMFVIPYLVILFKNMVIPAFVIPANLSITKNRYNKKNQVYQKKMVV